MPEKFFPDSDSNRELEAKRKKFLLGQECLKALSETERAWLEFLYDTHPWVAESLQTLQNQPEKNKESLIQELLRNSLETIVEQEAQSYLTTEFQDDPETLKNLRKFYNSPQGREQIIRACLAWKTNLSFYVNQEKPELIVALYEFLETIKEITPSVAKEIFIIEVSDLPDNTQFDLLDEKVKFLNKLANQMGKKMTKEALREILRKFSKDKEKQNMINRLKRVLAILI